MISKEYKEVVMRVAGGVDENAREKVVQVLGSSQARELYEDMQRRGFSKKAIVTYMKHGINDISQGNEKLSARAYIGAVAEEMSSVPENIGFIDELHDDGLLTDSQYNWIVHELKSRVKDRAGEEESALESLTKAAAVWILMVVGVVLMFFSGTGITGAVIGVAGGPPVTFFVGAVLFILGLFLRRR